MNAYELNELNFRKKFLVSFRLYFILFLIAGHENGACIRGAHAGINVSVCFPNRVVAARKGGDGGRGAWRQIKTKIYLSFPTEGWRVPAQLHAALHTCTH